MFTLLGSALGFSATGLLLTYSTPVVAVYSMAAGLIATGIIAFLTIRGKEREMHEEPVFAIHAQDIVHPPLHLGRFQWFTVGSFFAFMGVTGLTYFELYFFKQVLYAAEPQLLVAVAGTVVLAVSAVASVLLGHLSYRLGRWKVLIATSAFAAVPMFLIPYFSSFYVFLFLGALIGGAYGIFYSVSSALAADLVPKNQAGKYMALFNLALAGASTASPPIYGVLLFVFKHSVHDGYVALFSTSSLFFILGSATIFIAWRKTKAEHFDLNE